MEVASQMMVFILVAGLPLFCLFVAMVVLMVRSLLRTGHSSARSAEGAAQRQSLGEALKAQRARCQITQEVVAESVGVSRQAVSKWESGASEPSTANLLALAKLYGISVDELLKDLA